MLTRFDHIIKNALTNLSTSYVPDWSIFHKLLEIEESFDQSGELSESIDQEWGEALRDLNYSATPPDWSVFEVRMDALEDEPDAEFDEAVRERLDQLTDPTAIATSWGLMSDRLDKLNAELDAEFDQSVVDALDRLPESYWQERHWQMLSSRLDRLNDRPRLLMMKVIEAAAIILLLIQLGNLYSGIQRDNGEEPNMATYLDHILENNRETVQEETDWPSNTPNIQPSLPDKSTATDQANALPSGASSGNSKVLEETSGSSGPGEVANSSLKFRKSESRSDTRVQEYTQGSPQAITTLVSDEPIYIPYSYLKKLDDRLHYLPHQPAFENQITPHLNNDPHLIAYQYQPGRSHDSSPPIGIRDISLLSGSSMDSVLSSIPTLQVIRPKIYSSMEVGMLADATDVEIQRHLSILGPYNESTLNPGAYFRYKIHYRDIFGSLGGDYLRMRYNSGDNELAMITLPVELGYNFINLSSLRMYVSGGIAGRFVPSANYSTPSFNQASSYSTRSSKSTNGLLHKGPFEINSYLSGRVSVGMDININKKTSISLRYSYDHWLKGRGIGYNLDKFRSNHLAIGANLHL